MTDRIGRYCDRCGKVDDHARHTHALPDGSIVDYHFECCACEICQQIIDSSGGKTGLELVEHITGGGIDHLNPNKPLAVPDDLSELDDR